MRTKSLYEPYQWIQHIGKLRSTFTRINLKDQEITGEDLLNYLNWLSKVQDAYPITN